MLALADLHAHYGASHIVQGVDLAVGAGEVVGVFGRNGVGKTTLLKTIAGWIRASRGEIRFDGQRIDGAAADRICRLGVGFVPEDRRIFPGLTVEENLTLGFMQVPRRGGAANRAALADIYRRFPRLHERRRQHGTTLSGGEQQMLAIARVLVGAPRLLLVDEPSEGLAPMMVTEIYAILTRAEAGRPRHPAGRAECPAGVDPVRSLRGDGAGAGGAQRRRAGCGGLRAADGGDHGVIVPHRSLVFRRAACLARFFCAVPT